MMAVNAAAKGAFRIVRCIPRRYLKPTVRAKSANVFRIRLEYANHTRQRKHGRYQSDADTGFIFHAVDNRREMFELNPKLLP